MPDAQTLLTAMLLLPFAASLVAAVTPSGRRNLEAWLAGLTALAVFAIGLWIRPEIFDGAILRAHYAWLPDYGLNFSIRVDGFAWAFAMIVSGIGALVALYARYYMSPDDSASRFFSFLLGFMGAMMGVVISGNLIQLVFFWELTSIFSFLLIAYWHHKEAARDGARMALTVTAAGGLCLFAGVLIIGHIVGSYELDVVLASGPAIVEHALYVPALLLLVLGALTKSAQFPFHFWLPRAMTAPTPVSAYLHSATMVKAGVFLLARLWPVLAASDWWFWTLAPVGAATLLVGAFLAMFQQDLKGLLAYSTISHLGLIVLLLGLGSPLAAVAAIFHMINHATFKASLFMAAGIIDHEAGTRDIRLLGGLYRAMPITATLAIVAAAAMAGVPLLNGFLSKEMFFAETVETHVDSAFDHALPYLATLAGMFSVAYSLRLIDQVFFGPPATSLPRAPHDPALWMLAPAALLALMCVLVGVFPTWVIGPFLGAAAHGVLGAQTPHYSLAVWHGLNPALLMSIVALGAGTLTYLGLKDYLSGEVEGPPLLRRLSGRRLFERAIAMLSWRWARVLEELLGSNRLQTQLRLLVLAAVLAGFWPAFRDSGFSAAAAAANVWAWLANTWLSPAWLASSAPMVGMFDPALLLVWAVGVACAVGAAWQAKYHRLVALILMGGAGLATSITFVWYSAPDLALTQLLVEIVTVVLILLGLRWMPRRDELIPGDMKPSARFRRVRDLFIAIAAGAGAAALAFAMLTSPQGPTIGDEFVNRAYREGGGRNVVNVILVDFRGFDTMGEITVLGAVAITVFALLRRFRPARDSFAVPDQKRFQIEYDRTRYAPVKSPIDSHVMLAPGVIIRLLFPVICAMAGFLLLRGHDLPGGGFIAGLTFAIAFLLLYIAGGARWVEDRIVVLPVRWIGAGVLLATLTGMAAVFFGYPFLTTAFRYVYLPVFGKTPLASALVFDIGVFALVFGATVLMLIAIAHQSIRVYRTMEKAARAKGEK
ncbi:monovalent cation/H+ antiporter subunit A [Camelimonas abortus]|uniref:Monovalent cation/H+ antiporter subunit A n=1 Tax=Camelimonas abortus TaxID=1017184 RepID=A0ABV7LB07_9HYPH